MRQTNATLKWVAIVVSVVIFVVLGFLITRPDTDTVVQTATKGIAKDIAPKTPSMDDLMGISAPAEESPTPFPYIYIVKEGEWLSKICPGDWERVAEQNKLENPDLIYPGDRLELTDACEDMKVLAREEVKAPADIPLDEESNASIVSSSLVVPSAGEQSATVAVSHDSDGVPQCDADLPLGEKAFQWRIPGRDPIGTEDPEEYLGVLAKAEGLPEEAREYFLAELRKGDQGAFATEKLSRCQYLGTMVGQKVNGEIRPHRHTILNWDTELHRKKRITWGKRKQTWEEALANDQARRYEFVVGGNQWVLLRANICGNLILGKEPLMPPKVEETVSVPIAEPPPTPPTCTGTCVPLSRPRDCAMPGCVPRAPLSDAPPACALSPESALNQNSNPVQADGIQQEDGCSLEDFPKDEIPRVSFTALGGALVSAESSEALCRLTPDVEYHGLALICLPDGTVYRTE